MCFSAGGGSATLAPAQRAPSADPARPLPRRFYVPTLAASRGRRRKQSQTQAPRAALARPKSTSSSIARARIGRHLVRFPPLFVCDANTAHRAGGRWATMPHLLQHLLSEWAVDQAILAAEDGLVVIPLRPRSG
ncbi:hypothetical protein Taro_016680 [Colocasia esculenta]|uniref:Uncharacterized protein n=1 Tax=Colocasia esculenta TaxID=4460 RepID=A0A843UTN5_COLES|nr:hypothetical protein [Colocasia esculenta]